MISSTWNLLAQAAPGELVKVSPRPLHVPSDIRFILGAVALLTVALILGALFMRKRREDDLSGWRVHHRHHHHQSDGTGSGESSTRRRRRRRREHRPRNPTLAETGGLPPLRPEPPSDSAP